MKKWLIGVMTVLMAVSLAACTPTTEKQKKERHEVVGIRKIRRFRAFFVKIYQE